MISWIQRTFQHHFKIIFGIILAVTVLSFIFTIGSTPGIGRADHREVTQDFFGHNLASQEEKQRIADDARLSAALTYGGSIGADQMQMYAFQRLAALHLADEMHLPPTGPAELTDYIQGLRMFQGNEGRFDVSRYDAFRTSVKSSGAVSEADIVRVISDDVRVSKIERYLGGPGYVLPQDVADVLTKSDTTWTLSTATVDYSSYDPGIKLTDAELSKFFTDNSFRYTIAPRVSVDSVAFPAAAYMAEAAPTDAEVRQYYDSNPARFPKPAPAKGPSVKSDPAADFTAVKPQVRAALQLERARREATKAASDLAYALYEGKVARGPSLDSFLAARKLRAEKVAPFTLEAGPSEFGGSREVANAAFELSADRYYSEGIATPAGAVVLIWRESLPSRQPLLAEVRPKVLADAVDSEKRKRFIELGHTLKAGIERRLKAGEAFGKAAAEAAGAVKLDVKAYPPFTLRTEPQGMDPAVFGALEHLDKGGLSDMQPTAEKGVFVYAADKKAPALDPSNPRYLQIGQQLAMTYSRTDSLGLLGAIVETEVKRMEAALK